MSPGAVDTGLAASQRTGDAGGLSDRPAYCAPDTTLLQDEQTANRAATGCGHLVPDRHWVLAGQDHGGRSAHGLSGHAGGLITRETHGHGTVDGSLEHEGEEGGSGSDQGRGGVHAVGGQVDDVSDAAEDPGDEGGDLGRRRHVAVGDDGHALADDAGRVGQGADDLSPLLVGGALGGICVRHRGRLRRRQDALDVCHRDAGADADQQLAVQRLGHAGFRQDGLDGMGLAGQQDNLRSKWKQN